MQTFIQFALLGLGLGSLYALASQGLMVIYRGSGVLNFGHGAIGMIGAYVAYEFHNKHHQPFWLGLIRAAVRPLVPLLLASLAKRMPPEQEQAFRDCMRRGGEWDHIRRRCKR